MSTKTELVFDWAKPIVNLIMLQDLTDSFVTVPKITCVICAGGRCNLYRDTFINEAKIAYSSQAFVRTACTEHTEGNQCQKKPQLQFAWQLHGKSPLE